MKPHHVFDLGFFILLLMFVTSSAWANTSQEKSDHRSFNIEITDNLISLKAEQTSFKEILNDLEKKTGIKIKIFDGVDDRKISLNISSLPVYAIHTLLEKFEIKNFAIVYDNELSSKVIYILPEGKDIAEVIKGKTIIKPARFADGKNINYIKGREIITVTKGKNKVPIRYVKDEVLLRFHLGVTEKEIEEILKKHNLILFDNTSLSKIGYVKVKIPDGRDVIEVIKEIRKEYKVKIPEPNYIAGILTITDPLYENQWYVSDIDFDKAWDKSESENKVNIAVIDTGVNAEHLDLKGKILKGYDFVNDDPDSSDDHGHGTFVAGIISATANNIGIKGLYDYAEILPVKVIDSSGIGTYEDAAKGIIYATDKGAKVINLSIGGYGYSFMLQDAVDYALEKGCVVVAAGGNDGIDQAIYPAGYSDVIGISALGYNGQIWSDSNSGKHIDVSAPGLDIISTGLNGSYVYASGTSASAAMVSALAGILVSEKPELSSSFIERLIMQTAKDLGDKGRDKVYGSGEIDALASLEQEVEPFHDVAVLGIYLDSMEVQEGNDIYIMMKAGNKGTFMAEKVKVRIKLDNLVIYEENDIFIEDNRVFIINKKFNKTLTEKFTIRGEVSCECDDINIENNIKTVSFQYKYDPDNKLYVLYKNRPFVHSWVAYQAYQLLPSGNLKTELNNNLWGGASYNDLFGATLVWQNDYSVPSTWSANSTLGLSVFEGTWEEDEDGLGTSARNHFWNPDGGFNDGIPLNDSNLTTALAWWNQALTTYSANTPLAYYYLGRVVHLLGDMGVPEHVHNDAHMSNFLWVTNKDDYSNYEEYTKLYYRDYSASGSPKDINSLPLNFPSYHDVPSSYDHDLAKLFYNQAQFTQHFDSSDNNGDNNGYGGSTINMGISPEDGWKRQSYQAIAYLEAGQCIPYPLPGWDCIDKWNANNGIDPNTNITVIWEKPCLTGYCFFSQLPEGPAIGSSYHYIDISRGKGQISYSDGLWNAQKGTFDRLKVSYIYRGQSLTDYIINPKNIDSPYRSVPDRYVSQQMATIFPENIRYVAALYQLFWDKTHNTPNTYTLNVSKNGSGTVTSSPAGINCGSTCSASYTSSTTVTLTANPATGWSFSGWSACSGTGTCKVTMSSDKSVTATFTQNPASFQVTGWTIDDSLSIHYRNNGDGIFQSGEEIHIRPQILNNGTGSATSIDVSLVYSGAALLVDPGTNRYPDLGPGASGYPNNNRSFWVESTDWSFTGPSDIDLQIIWNESSTPFVISNAINLNVASAPIISINPNASDFGVVAPGNNVTYTMTVRNSGSGVLTVSDVQTSNSDTTVPNADRAFTLNPGMSKNIQVTIDTSAIASGTTISRDVWVVSDGRLADNTPPSNGVTLTGLVSDSIPVYEIPNTANVTAEYPDISGDWICWTDFRNGNSDIFAYQISTGTEVQITSNTNEQYNCRISGNLIVWADKRNDPGNHTNADIYGYDLSNPSLGVFPVATAPGHEHVIGLDGNLVAFAHDYYQFTENSCSSYARNLIIYEYIGNGQFSTNCSRCYHSNFTPPSGHSEIVYNFGYDVYGSDFNEGMLVDKRYDMYWSGSQWECGTTYWEVIDFAAGETSPRRISLTGSVANISASAHHFAYIDSTSYHELWLWHSNDTVEQLTFPNSSTDQLRDALGMAGDEGAEIIVYDYSNKTAHPGLYYLDRSDNNEYLIDLTVKTYTDELRVDGSAIVWKDFYTQSIRYTFLNQSVTSLVLNPGWNLISSNVQPGSTNIASVLSSISGMYSSVYAYENILKKFMVYPPDSDPNTGDLTSIEAGKGYWIYITQAVSLRITGLPPSNTIPLVSGWNLVGYNLPSTQTILSVLNSIEGKYISVWSFENGSWKVYDPANPGFSDLNDMQPGYGYWINMNEATTWTLP